MSENPSNFLYFPMENIQFDSPVVITVIQCAYGIPSIIIMIFLLIWFGIRKNYTNPFYRNVQFDLAVNIVCYLNTWTAMRLERFESAMPFLKQIEIFVPGMLTISKYLTNYFFHLQSLSAAFMTANRILTVKFPNWTVSNWRFAFIASSVSVCIYSVLPNLVLYHGFTAKVHIMNGTLTRIRNVEAYNKGMLVTTILSVVYFFILLFLGLYSRYTVSRIHNNAHSGYITRKLTKVALVYSFLYSGIIFWTITSTADNKYDFLPIFIRSHNSYILGFGSDLLTLSLPYVLFLFDANVQRDLFKKQSGVTKVGTVNGTTVTN
ncbi:hypothetical protein CAEBREN_24881 [Caenorhabditis brenneri]|uniref:Serpentine receptor class gamma n=1 Tax=Caenorhabditis brenneri TaxID=135651 RepID=G0MT37_CAEBE|nr:hypothetical protein CAEBREN_24881 [Caenorhabditis brenneri]